MRGEWVEGTGGIPHSEPTRAGCDAQFGGSGGQRADLGAGAIPADPHVPEVWASADSVFQLSVSHKPEPVPYII